MPALLKHATLCDVNMIIISTGTRPHTPTSINKGQDMDGKQATPFWNQDKNLALSSTLTGYWRQTNLSQSKQLEPISRAHLYAPKGRKDWHNSHECLWPLAVMTPLSSRKTTTLMVNGPPPDKGHESKHIVKSLHYAKQTKKKKKKKKKSPLIYCSLGYHF